MSIAALIAELITAGTPPDLVGRVAEAIASGGQSGGQSGGNPVDKAAERRRAWDRERKAKARAGKDPSGGIPPDPVDTKEKGTQRENTSSSLRSEEVKTHTQGAGATPTREKRPTRLPEGWVIDEDQQSDLLANGFTQPIIDRETEKIRNWSAYSKNGAKRDWRAFVRNWFKDLEDERSHDKQSTNKSAGRITGHDTALAYLRQVAAGETDQWSGSVAGGDAADGGRTIDHDSHPNAPRRSTARR